MTLPALAGPPKAPSNTRVPTVLGRGAAAYGRTREVAAMGVWTLALFLTLALASYRGGPGDMTTAAVPAGADWVGPVGAICARGLVSLLGLVAWSLPAELLLLGVPLVRGKESAATPGRVAGDVLIAVVSAALVQILGPERTAFGAYPAGGLVGELFGELARSLFSTAGSLLVGFACLGLVLISRAAFSFIALARLVARLAVRVAATTAQAARAVSSAWRRARELEQQRREIDRIASEPHIDTSPRDEVIVATPALDPDDVLGAALAELPPKRTRRTSRSELATSSTFSPAAASTASNPLPQAAPLSLAPSPSPPVPGPVASPVLPPTAVPLPAPSLDSGSDSIDGPPDRKRRARKAPTIVDTSAALEKEHAAPDLAPPKPSSFELPRIDMLVADKPDPTLAIDRDKLFANANKLVETLAHYGVQGKVEDILPGPTVTTYEVSPAAGTKVSKVASLADDLALALARKVRIVAPIPGKNRIGFELPNDRRVPVVLRDLVEDRRFQTLDVPLPIVLGRDILGNPVYADLAGMPHVIVAGATGAGKSVGLNVMLTSLLYRRSPDELRLLMIDPKVVELAPFDRIPHMLLPVVTDMKQASTALKWAVDEMERRYQLFADAGTKNIATYNAWVSA